MTYEQQIRAALRLLGSHAPGLHGDIVFFLACIKSSEDFFRVGTKRNKQQLKKIHTALTRAQKEINQLPLFLQHNWFSPGLEDYIRTVELWLAEPSITAPRHRTAPKQKTAVQYAHKLLSKNGFPIKATRKGLWHQLSAILFGDPRADLFRHMLAFSKRRKQLLDPNQGQK
jgi:hypothetical protein